MSSNTQVPRSTAAAQAASGRGERLATLSTVVSAILASSCCWLPLLLLGLGLLGVSTAGFARTLRVGIESYRPLFMVVTFGCLALAFYITYRPRRPASAGSAEDC
jgi:hypothetical protein